MIIKKGIYDNWECSTRLPNPLHIKIGNFLKQLWAEHQREAHTRLYAITCSRAE